MKLDDVSSQDRRFDAGAFHPNLPGGRASGFLRLDWSRVRFESDKGAFELPLDGLKLELGGANDRLIFLSHPAHPQVTIHTADHEVLNHPVVAQTPALAAQCGTVRKKKRATVAVLASVVILLLAGIVGLVLSRDALVKWAANTVPVEWEIKAGEKLFAQIVASKRVIKDADVVADMKQLTDTLVQGIPDNRYSLTFHIVEDPTLNAFAMPGGNVVLHTGLLLAAETPEEVAGVLAHEIAHITRRHSIRNIISSAALYVLVSALVGDASGVLAVLADNSAFLLDRSFSRDFEREADDVGWEYLLRTDVEPRGMITFFEKMQQEEKKMLEKVPVSGADKALAFLSTHPATQERIDRLEAKWRQLEKRADFRKIPLNYPDFKTKLRAQLHLADTPRRPE